MEHSFINVTKRDDGEITTISYGGGVEGLKDVVGLGTSEEITEAKSALYALSDFAVFCDYDEDISEPGFHVNKAKTEMLKRNRATNIGVVSTAYDGDYFDGMPVELPTDAEHPLGWAVLNRRRGRFYFTPITDDSDGQARARKHDFLDELLEGYSFEIHVRGFNANKDEDGNGIADKVVHSWTLPEDEARAFRAEGYNKAQSRRTARKAYRKAVTAADNGRVTTKAKEAVEAHSGLKVAGRLGKPVTLVAGTVYAWRTDKSEPITLPFDIASTASVMQVQNLENKGWTFGLTSKG